MAQLQAAASTLMGPVETLIDCDRHAGAAVAALAAVNAPVRATGARNAKI